MALTLEEVFEGPIEDLWDAVIAQKMFKYVKRGHEDPHEAAKEEIDNMSNTEFLLSLAAGIENLKERKLL